MPPQLSLRQPSWPRPLPLRARHISQSTLSGGTAPRPGTYAAELVIRSAPPACRRVILAVPMGARNVTSGSYRPPTPVPLPLWMRRPPKLPRRMDRRRDRSHGSKGAAPTVGIVRYPGTTSRPRLFANCLAQPVWSIFGTPRGGSPCSEASSDPEARAVSEGQARHHFIDGNDFGVQEGHGTAVGGLVPNAGNIKVPKVVSR